MQRLFRSLAAAVVAATLMALLAACGGATAPAASAPTQAAATAAPQPTAAPAQPTAAAVQPTAAPAQPTAAPAQPTAAPAATTASPPTSAPTQPAKLNLNDVTAEQLQATIPSFSNRMVREFFEYRPYISIQQFRREIGKYVSAEQVAAYEQYVYVPVDVDAADAATLQQLPGVDAALADQLIAGRPYGSTEAFLAQLAKLAPQADTAAARQYLAG